MAQETTTQDTCGDRADLLIGEVHTFLALCVAEPSTTRDAAMGLLVGHVASRGPGELATFCLAVFEDIALRFTSNPGDVATILRSFADRIEADSPE